MPKSHTEEMIEQQGIQEDIDRWRDESPAAGRVAAINEAKDKGSVEKGLRAVAEYRSGLENQVRRFPGSSLLLAGAAGLLLGVALTRCVEANGFWRGR